MSSERVKCRVERLSREIEEKGVSCEAASELVRLMSRGHYMEVRTLFVGEPDGCHWCRTPTCRVEAFGEPSGSVYKWRLIPWCRQCWQHYERTGEVSYERGINQRRAADKRQPSERELKWSER